MILLDWIDIPSVEMSNLILSMDYGLADRWSYQKWLILYVPDIFLTIGNCIPYLDLRTNVEL